MMFYVFWVGMIVVCVVAMCRADRLNHHGPSVLMFLCLMASIFVVSGRLLEPTIKAVIRYKVEKQLERTLREMYGSDIYDSVMAEGVLAGHWDEDGKPLPRLGK